MMIRRLNPSLLEQFELQSKSNTWSHSMSKVMSAKNMRHLFGPPLGSSDELSLSAWSLAKDLSQSKCGQGIDDAHFISNIAHRGSHFETNKEGMRDEERVWDRGLMS